MDAVERGANPLVISPQPMAGSLDWERLARPVPGGNPAGAWLRYEGIYDAIKEARRADDTTLPTGIWQSDIKRADWPRVQALCLDALYTHSKDLQLAAWLAESLTYQYGFSGCADGLQALHVMLEHFWDNFWPATDEEDPAARFAAIEWLNQKLPSILRLVALTESNLNDEKVYCWADWIDAGQSEKRRGSSEDVRMTTADLQSRIQTSSKEFCLQRLKDVRRACQKLGRLDAVLSERCGRWSPSLGRINEELRAIERIYAALPWIESEDPANPLAGAITRPRTRAGGRMTVGGVTLTLDAYPWLRSRDEAYTALAAIADYLMTVEPHSPAPHLIKRAVSWGRKPLSQLLLELMHEGMDLQQFQRMLGMDGTRSFEGSYDQEDHSGDAYQASSFHTNSYDDYNE